MECHLETPYIFWPKWLDKSFGDCEFTVPSVSINGKNEVLFSQSINQLFSDSIRTHAIFDIRCDWIGLYRIPNV